MIIDYRNAKPAVSGDAEENKQPSVEDWKERTMVAEVKDGGVCS